MFLVLIAFSLAVLMGAIFATLLARLRPGWSNRTRLLISALSLPGLTILATALGIAFVVAQAAGVEKTMLDLAVAAIAQLGAMFAGIALAGSFVGAALAGRKRRA